MVPMPRINPNSKLNLLPDDKLQAFEAFTPSPWTIYNNLQLQLRTNTDV